MKRKENNEYTSETVALIPSVWIWYVLVILMFVGAAGAIQGSGLFFYKHFAPQREQARREVFEQSQSYVQGKITYLTRLHLEYLTATDPAHKCALRSVVLNEASTATTLPAPLLAWVDTLTGDMSCVR